MRRVRVVQIFVRIVEVISMFVEIVMHCSRIGEMNPSDDNWVVVINHFYCFYIGSYYYSHRDLGLSFNRLSSNESFLCTRTFLRTIRMVPYEHTLASARFRFYF